METAQMPLVSVLVPTYNRCKWLKLAIESILAQTYSHFEIIICDNASNDGTEEMVKSIGDERIFYKRHCENLGAVRNYNLTLAMARGKYVHFFSDDDVMTPENIGLKVEVMEKNSEIGVVHTDIFIIDGNSKKISEKHWAQYSFREWNEMVSNKMFRGGEYFRILNTRWNFLSMTTVMVKKSVLDTNKLEFNNQLAYLVDWELWMKLALHTHFHYIDQKLVHLRQHGTNESGQMDEKIYFRELWLLKACVYAYADKSVTFSNNHINRLIQFQLNKFVLSQSSKKSFLKKIQMYGFDIYLRIKK